MHRFPSMISTPLYLHSLWSIVRSSFRSFPYMILRLRFGTQTIWYLHSHTVCDKLLFILRSFRRSQGHPNALLSTKWSFFYKYFSIAFFILTGLAGGLASELIHAKLIGLVGRSRFAETAIPIHILWNKHLAVTYRICCNIAKSAMQVHSPLV